MLDQELGRLPAKYRAPLVLCYLRGQTHDQAAAELRVPSGPSGAGWPAAATCSGDGSPAEVFGPTAVLFGPGLELPAHLLTEVVPAPLVAATVQGAFAIGTSQTVHATAAAASVLALTQGVLMSMKLSQLKWIGLALLATSLSTGGAIVVASAGEPRHPGEKAGTVVSAAGLENPGQDPAVPPVPTGEPPGPSSKTTEERLRALERQIDRIYRLAGKANATTPFPTVAVDTPTLDRLETKLAHMLRTSVETSTNSPRCNDDTGELPLLNDRGV